MSNESELAALRKRALSDECVEKRVCALHANNSL